MLDNCMYVTSSTCLATQFTTRLLSLLCTIIHLVRPTYTTLGVRDGNNALGIRIAQIYK